MPPINHAVLSASAAHRWLACPPSAMLEKELPDETTVYAEEGSVAHEVAEYSLTSKPKCYPKANGVISDRIGLEQVKFEENNDGYIHKGQNKAKNGIARCTDVIVCGTSKIEKGYNNPAMFPPVIPEYIIKMLTDEGDLVIDPFIGSGTTGRVAERLNRRWIGFEIDKRYGGG